MIIKSDVDNLERRDENENYVEILKKRRNNFSRWMAFFLLASHVDRARLFECLVSGEKEKAWNTKACISSSQLLFPLFFFLLLRFFCRLRRKGTKETTLLPIPLRRAPRWGSDWTLRLGTWSRGRSTKRWKGGRWRENEEEEVKEEEADTWEGGRRRKGKWTKSISKLEGR